MKNRTIIALLGITVASLILSGCMLSPKKPGRTFMPDMQYSNAYETYAGSQSVLLNIKADTMTARLPVTGTIPRGAIPFSEKVRSDEKYLMSYTMANHRDENPDKYQEYYDKAGALLENPIPLSKEAIAEAKGLYTIYCSVCHGEAGAGNGQIVVLPDGSDGPYTAIPPAYESRLPTITDGNMFYSISYGKGMMGGHGSQLSVEQRWKLVHYIKDLANMYTDADFEAAKAGEESMENQDNDNAEHDGEEHEAGQHDGAVSHVQG